MVSPSNPFALASTTATSSSAAGIPLLEDVPAASTASTTNIAAEVQQQEEDDDDNDDGSSFNTTNDDANNFENGLKTDYLKIRSHTNSHNLIQQIENDHLYATTQRLIVVCPGCEPDWTTTAIMSLLVRIAKLPCLQELKLNCVGLLDVPFPLRLVTSILQQQQEQEQEQQKDSVTTLLQVLDLDDVALCANNQEEVDALAEIISKLSTTNKNYQFGLLKEFRLFGCFAEPTLTNNTHKSIKMDPLWASLANFEKIEIDAVDDGLLGTIDSCTVGILAQSKTLKQFHLNGFALDNDCLLALAQALEVNTTLTDLSFDLYSLGHPGNGAFALAESLRINQHVTKLHISISHAWNDNKFLQAMANALSTDCTLKSLIIGTCSVFDEKTVYAFCQMMKRNYVLELLQLSRYKGKHKALLHYYLKLNSQHRGYFHSNFGTIPRCEWVNRALVSVKDDIDGLYYFLHMNPMLCQTAGGEVILS